MHDEPRAQPDQPPGNRPGGSSSRGLGATAKMSNEEDPTGDSDAISADVDAEEDEAASVSGGDVLSIEGEGIREKEAMSGGEDEESSISSNEGHRRMKRVVDYVMGYEKSDVTAEGLKEMAGCVPADILEEQALENNLLHHYLGNSSNSLISLDVVEYLLQLAPDAVRQVDEGRPCSHAYGQGSLPLHLALFNANCPPSVIRLFLELNPAAVHHSWEKGYGLPLHCYIAGALKHYPQGEWDHDEGYFDEWAPAYPTRELDFDIVNELVQANPDALTDASGQRGTPLHLLCEGMGATLPLAKLLTDGEEKCFAMSAKTTFSDDADYRRVPIWRLLENIDIDPFPTDVFRYLLEGNPSMLIHMKYEAGTRRRKSPLHLACANPHTSLEAVQLILQADIGMARVTNKDDGCLPLHTLCKNAGLSEQASVDILTLLAQTYPESVLQRTGKDRMSWMKDERKLPIHIASAHKTLDFCKFLIEKYPDGLSKRALHYPNKYNLPQGRGVLPFHLACSYGSLDLVKFLLEKDPSVIHERTFDDDYKRDEETGTRIEVDAHNSSLLQTGDLPLHLAASRKNAPEKIDVVNFLLQTDPDAASRPGTWGYLPLHGACRRPSLDVIRELLCSNPETIDAKNIFGQLPVHILMKYSDRDSFDCLQLLAEKQPNGLGIIDSRGLSCVHRACASRDTLQDTLQKLQLIADTFPEAFRSRSDEHGLPIHYACKEKCKVEVVRFLADQFPESLDVHIEPLGLPLHCAARKPKDLDRYTNEEERKATKAALDSVEFLLSRRYGSAIEDGEPTLPIYHLFLRDKAITNKDPVIERFRYVDDSKTDEEGCNTLHLVFGATRNSELIQECMLRSDTVGVSDNRGWLPLHYALRHNASPSLIQRVLDEHAVESGLVDVHGMTLLHVACKYGCPLETVKMLLEYDPILSVRTDNHGRTALHAACGGSAHMGVILHLMREYRGIRLLHDDDGDLPIHKACRAGNTEVIAFLLKQTGAHVTVRNNRNELPMHLLCNRVGKDEEILESTQYVETIFNLLQTYPETVLVDQCPYEKVVSDAVEKVKEFYANHSEIKASHGWKEHVLVVFDHAEKALLSLNSSLSPKDAMEIKLAALLHDVDDRKYFPDACQGTYPHARAILDAVGISEREEGGRSNISHERIIKLISFVGCSENGNSVPDEVKESDAYHMLIPRWADRLEAVGAKGVVRCYQYNQERGRPLCSEESPRPTSEEELWTYAPPERLQEYMDRGGTSTDMISHYYDKLLHIARPPKDIVRNPYLERMAESSSKDLVDVCLRFGRLGAVDEDHIMALMNETR